jgi:hypothetical protein
LFPATAKEFCAEKLFQNLPEPADNLPSACGWTLFRTVAIAERNQPRRIFASAVTPLLRK